MLYIVLLEQLHYRA